MHERIKEGKSTDWYSQQSTCIIVTDLLPRHQAKPSMPESRVPRRSTESERLSPRGSGNVHQWPQPVACTSPLHPRQG